MASGKKAGRKPTVEDFDVWMLEAHGTLQEIGDEYDWNAIALGFLVARGVGVKHLDNNGMWDLLSALNCGDRARYLAALTARGIE